MRDSRKSKAGRKVSVEEALAKSTSRRAARSRDITRRSTHSGVKLAQSLLEGLGLGGAAHPIRRLHNPGGAMAIGRNPGAGIPKFGSWMGRLHNNRQDADSFEFIQRLMAEAGSTPNDRAIPFVRGRAPAAHMIKDARFLREIDPRGGDIFEILGRLHNTEGRRRMNELLRLQGLN